jgi:hypothetical protein
MATRERPGDRGRRQARIGVSRVAADFRQARVGAGLSLRTVGRAVRASHARVGRFERGEIRSADTDFIGACCAVVGLELVLRAYPAGDALRDRAQQALLARLGRELHATIRMSTKVPLPIDRDLRAWDAVIGTDAWTAHVEAESRIDDAQALERKLALKQRDGRAEILILLVADTRANRAALAAIRPSLHALLPLDGRAILAALRAGQKPAGSGLVML